MPQLGQMSQKSASSRVSGTIAPTPSPVVVPPTSGMPVTTYITIMVAVIVMVIVVVAAELILGRRK